MDYRQLANLQLAGVQWVLNRPQTRQIAGLLPHNDAWLEVPDPLPRVRLQAISHSWPHAPREEAHHAERDVNYVRLIYDRPGELHISVDSRGERLLVVGESFYHGWQAQVDGRPVEVLRVHGDFMGCLIEPGRHEVHLCFRPASLVWGKRLTLAGLAGIAAVFVVFLHQPQRLRDPLETEFVTNTEPELAHV